MLQLAAGPGGTAPKAQAMGYSVGGKTGTAHKQEGGGYAEQQVPRLVRRHGADRAPAHRRRGDGRRAERPASYGGDVAAPVFSQVVQQTLRMLDVPPDIEVRPQIVRATCPREQESF